MRKILSVVKMTLLDGLTYRTDMLLYVLSGIVRPIVMLIVWLAVISSGAKLPLSQNEFVIYYLLVMLIGVFTSVWTSPFLSVRIRQGRISPYLLKPFSYLSWDLGQNIGEKVFKFIYLIPIVIGILIIFNVHIPSLSLVNLLFFLPSLIMAFISRYLLDYVVGLTAFWLDDSRSLGDFLDLLVYIFSGILVPIETLPKFWQNVSFYLPFRYMMSFPIELILGRLSFLQEVSGLILSLLWTVFFVFLYKFIWSQGMKRYSAAGA